jgi:hypothetical protein
MGSSIRDSHLDNEKIMQQHIGHNPHPPTRKVRTTLAHIKTQAHKLHQLGERTAETIVGAVLSILNEYLIEIQDICFMIAVEKCHPLVLRSNLIGSTSFLTNLMILGMERINLYMSTDVIYTMIQELKDVMRTVPEIEGLVGHEDAGRIMSLKECDAGNEVKSSLQSTFVKLMTASKDIVSEAIAKLITRLNTESKVKHFFES